MTVHRLNATLHAVEPPADTELADKLNGVGWLLRAERISAAKVKNRKIAEQAACPGCGGEGRKISFDPYDLFDAPVICRVCWGEGYLK